METDRETLEKEQKSAVNMVWGSKAETIVNGWKNYRAPNIGRKKAPCGHTHGVLKMHRT